MLQYHAFTFNMVGEQTYVIWDETKEAIIVDAGCSNKAEEQQLVNFIEKQTLLPVRLLFTHLHFDHCFGMSFVAEHWNLTPEAHAAEISLMPSLDEQLKLFGIPPVIRSHSSVKVMPFRYDASDVITFGNTTLQVLHLPGHAPGHVGFYDATSGLLLSGDVLFQQGIGRTDLWHGSQEELLESILTKLMTLPDNVVVLPGHGPKTTIGFERKNNPFLQ